jgi:hypothetical protein
MKTRTKLETVMVVDSEPEEHDSPFFKLGSIVGGILIPLLLGISNPQPKAYTEYIVWAAKTRICRQEQTELSMQASCVMLSAIPPQASSTVLRQYVHRENYLVFSIYTLDGFGFRDRSIGIGGHFLPLPSNHQ